MRMRKKRNLEPRLERCESVTIMNPAKFKGKWLSLKPDATAIYVEIGCGKGRFSKQMALANPDVLYIAIEKEKSAVVLAMEKAVREEIKNLYFIAGDASDLCNYFALGEVHSVFVNFCDPWTGNKHAKRRLTHENFLRLYRQIAIPGGKFYFKTDNDALFRFSVWSLKEFGMENMIVTNDLHATDIPNIMTEYEERFSSQGIKIKRIEASFPLTPPEPLKLACEEEQEANNGEGDVSEINEMPDNEDILSQTEENREEDEVND